MIFRIAWRGTCPHCQPGQYGRACAVSDNLVSLSQSCAVDGAEVLTCFISSSPLHSGRHWSPSAVTSEQFVSYPDTQQIIHSAVTKKEEVAFLIGSRQTPLIQVPTVLPCTRPSPCHSRAHGVIPDFPGAARRARPARGGPAT